MELKNPDIRYLNDMKEVLFDQEWAKTAPNLELYYMYRGIEYKDGLRYDITVIPFQKLGKEFTKTKGHEHPDDFAELYQIIKGNAIFLMQKRTENSSLEIENVYAVEAKRGDKVFIPAHYGHVTINPGPDDLKMSNWVADGFQSDYSLFLEKQGACYYALVDKSCICTKSQLNEIKWLKNKNYGKVPKLRFEEPNKNIPKDLKKALLAKWKK